MAELRRVAEACDKEAKSLGGIAKWDSVVITCHPFGNHKLACALENLDFTGEKIRGNHKMAVWGNLCLHMTDVDD